MPAFAYRAATPDGEMLNGVEDATSQLVLERVLAGRGLYPVSISPTRARAPHRARKIARRAAVAEAIRHIALLLDAGFPLDRSLGIAVKLVPNFDVSAALDRVRTLVRGGRSLADALAQEPRYFPPLVVGMTRAGERGGTLGPSLDRLAGHLERAEELRSQVVSAMIYPAVLVAAGGATLAALLLFVLPRFAGMFEELGVALPASTSFLIGAGQVAGRWWPAALAAVVAIVAAVALWRRTTRGRQALDRFLLSAPVLGPLRARLATSRLGWTLSALLESGMPILPALEISADAIADTAVVAQMARVRKEVRVGTRLADALRNARIFPELFTEMVALGEEAGRMPQMLARAARMAEEELTRGIASAVKLIEPALIIVFGIVVGFVALGLLQAIYGIRMDVVR
jgi:type II secretory pathway component PulF